jgi:UDP-N-acetylglucosamine 2-epimerase (non-hydrolysing)
VSSANVIDFSGHGIRPVVLLVAGSRAECVKLAPVARAIGRSEVLTPIVLNSGQHHDIVHAMLEELGIRRPLALAPMPSFSHLQPACDYLEREIRAIIKRVKPAVVLVAGNTATSYSGARAAHAERRTVGHVEAGLRTDHSLTPFPEEWLRREIARYAHLHFASCRTAAANLVAEGIEASSIFQVGSPAIDSLARVLHELGNGRDHHARDTILVTLHRSENYDRGAELLCEWLIQIAKQQPHLRVVFPLHANPRIAAPVHRRLRWLERCEICDPMSYREFIEAARSAAIIISDSGGIQEEAPHLGVPLVVPRTNTERPEALQTGWVRLADVRRGTVVATVLQMLGQERGAALPIDASAPFGAGNAGARIVRILERRSVQLRTA